jgi:hypothetical protein
MLNAELVRRIEAQEAWTFQECLGLAAEFGTKVRLVVALVMMKGKRYSDGDAGGSFAAGVASADSSATASPAADGPADSR